MTISRRAFTCCSTAREESHQGTRSRACLCRSTTESCRERRTARPVPTPVVRILPSLCSIRSNQRRWLSLCPLRSSKAAKSARRPSHPMLLCFTKVLCDVVPWRADGRFVESCFVILRFIADRVARGAGRPTCTHDTFVRNQSDAVVKIEDNRPPLGRLCRSDQLG